MDDSTFSDWLTAELASLPGVVAVTLGGSRARGTNRPGSDWDFAIYYRHAFDPSSLANKGWPGDVSPIGGWGGGVMNGGAWLTIEQRRVDVHYRDLEDVEHWSAEARQGRFKKELLLFYAAGIPTYVLLAELATHIVLSGNLPRPQYPERLAAEAGRSWHADAILSLGYGESALRRHFDAAVCLANVSRSLIEEAHSRLAMAREWVINEKGIVDRAGLGDAAAMLITAADAQATLAAIDAIRADIAGGRADHLG